MQQGSRCSRQFVAESAHQDPCQRRNTVYKKQPPSGELWDACAAPTRQAKSPQCCYALAAIGRWHRITQVQREKAAEAASYGRQLHMLFANVCHAGDTSPHWSRSRHHQQCAVVHLPCLILSYYNSKHVVPSITGTTKPLHQLMLALQPHALSSQTAQQTTSHASCWSQRQLINRLHNTGYAILLLKYR